MIIGREKEKKILLSTLNEEYSQFIAIYGRRRVGKTFLIRETFNYSFQFQFTGAAGLTARKQLSRFKRALKEHGLTDIAELCNWGDAFSEFKRLINQLPNGKKIIFFDELPWMDAPRSSFLSELETFWNGWASARKDIVFIVCGSSTSWMVKKIIKNKGGLHNRLNHRIALKPFCLGLCEELVKSRGLALTRKQILEAYMIFGGVPYYWSLLQKGNSITQEIDRLIFSSDGELSDEFEMLYASLFKSPEPYLKVIELLSRKKMGLTRKEIIKYGKFNDNGQLSDLLNDLEWCGFIRSYSAIGLKNKSAIYQLIDHFTLFYYEYADKQIQGSNYWKSMHGTPKYNTWCGLAFERVCLWHIEQIKKKLGINGILTNEYGWKYTAKEDNEETKGAQIDLLIDRNDDIINLCEMKYSNSRFCLTKEYQSELEHKKNVFENISKTKKAIHTVLITTEGLQNSELNHEFQDEITLSDLFEK